MPDNNNYAQLTLPELQTEAKKMRSMEITAAVFVGFLIGVMVYGVATKGFGFLHIFLPLLLIAGIVKGTQTLKQKQAQVRAEIKARSAA